MKIWHYHRTTGALMGEGVADADPMQPGEWLMPAFSTTVRPPAQRAHQIPVFTGSGWEQKPDWRGVPLYAPGEAGTPIPLITRIGDTPEALGLTDKAPPTASARQAAVFDGLTWTLLSDWRGVALYGPGESGLGRVASIDKLGDTPAMHGLSDEEPPDAGEREAAILDGGVWRLVPDWRGVKLYDKASRAPVSIEAPGVAPDLDVVTELEPLSGPCVFEGGAWVPDVQALREQKRAEIKAERDRRIQQGGVLVDRHWFHADTLSRMRYFGLVQRGGGYVNSVKDWRTMTGETVTMDSDLAAKVMAACAESDIAIDAAAQVHLAALQEIAAPDAYDFSGGWPQAMGV